MTNQPLTAHKPALCPGRPEGYLSADNGLRERTRYPSACVHSPSARSSRESATVSLPDNLIKQILATKAPLPETVKSGAKGVYALWLDEMGFRQLKLRPGAHGIAYVGVSASSGGLAKRFREEWRPKHSGRSSPRRTIGSLLRRRLHLKPRPRPGSGSQNFKYFTFGEEGEQALTNWIEEHASFGYIEVNVDDLPGVYRVEDVETMLIQRLRPPLNISKWRNPEKRRLMGARRSAREAALRWSIRERRSGSR